MMFWLARILLILVLSVWGPSLALAAPKPYLKVETPAGWDFQPIPAEAVETRLVDQRLQGRIFPENKTKHEHPIESIDVFSQAFSGPEKKSDQFNKFIKEFAPGKSLKGVQLVSEQKGAGLYRGSLLRAYQIPYGKTHVGNLIYAYPGQNHMVVVRATFLGPVKGNPVAQKLLVLLQQLRFKKK